MRLVAPLVLLAVACGAPAQEAPTRSASAPPPASASPPPASSPPPATSSVARVCAAPPPPAASPPPAAPPPAPATSAKPPKPVAQMTKEERAEALAAEAVRLQAQMAALGQGGLQRIETFPSNVAPKAGASKADVQVGRLTATVPIPDVDCDVAALVPRFRDCYQNALNANGAKVGQGRGLLDAQISPTGAVTWALPASGTYAGASEMNDCLVATVMGSTFKSPGANGSKLTIELTFTAAK